MDLVIGVLLTPPAICIFALSSAVLLWHNRKVLRRELRIGQGGRLFWMYRLDVDRTTEGGPLRTHHSGVEHFRNSSALERFSWRHESCRAQARNAGSSKELLGLAERTPESQAWSHRTSPGQWLTRAPRLGR